MAEKTSIDDAPRATHCYRSVDDGVEFRDLSRDELIDEVGKLQTLAVAVGQCAPTDVPEPVYTAWQTPIKYRQDELHWLRERYGELLATVSRLILMHDKGTPLGGPHDSSIIEKLREIVNDSPNR